MSEVQHTVKIQIEAAEEGDTLVNAETLRLTFEGPARLVNLVGEIVVTAVGGKIQKATLYDAKGAEVDITNQFDSPAPEKVDLLDTGDAVVE